MLRVSPIFWIGLARLIATKRARQRVWLVIDESGDWTVL